MKRKFSDIILMTPENMAKESQIVQNSYNYILTKISEIKTKELREVTQSMFLRTMPSFVGFYQTAAEKEKLFSELLRAGYIHAGISVDDLIPETDALPPVWAASGSGYRGHHAWPGGLVVHIEENMRLSLYLDQMHREMFDTGFDRDMIIFAQTAHDLAKSWMSHWLDDGSCKIQFAMADTGVHHIYGLAESIRNGIPPAYLYAQAATHVKATSKTNNNTIVDFLKAAFLIAQKDPVEYGIFDEKDRLAFDYKRMEYWFTYMGDHMVVFTVPQTRRAVKALKTILEEELGFSIDDFEGKKFNQLRNYVLSQLGSAVVFELLAEEGMVGVKAKVFEMIDFT